MDGRSLALQSEKGLNRARDHYNAQQARFLEELDKLRQELRLEVRQEVEQSRNGIYKRLETYEQAILENNQKMLHYTVVSNQKVFFSITKVLQDVSRSIVTSLLDVQKSLDEFTAVADAVVAITRLSNQQTVFK
jgi:hypothetical protein